VDENDINALIGVLRGGQKLFIGQPETGVPVELSDDAKWAVLDALARPGADGWQASEATRDVIAERRRQIEAEGWSAEHDDEHTDGAMALAAGMYAVNSASPTFLDFDDGFGPDERYPIGWPWHRQWWKPKNPRRDLVRAAALIIAEIERLDRLAAATAPQPEALADELNRIIDIAERTSMSGDWRYGLGQIQGVAADLLRRARDDPTLFPEPRP